MPPLFCLWVNSHGSWPMGMVVFGIFIASGMVEGTWGHAYATRWSGPQLRKLLIAAGASALAVFINPVRISPRCLSIPKLVRGAASVGNIQEFASIDFHTPWGKVAMALILGVLLISVFSHGALAFGRSLDLSSLALYFGLTYLRFMFLAGILRTICLRQANQTDDSL